MPRSEPAHLPASPPSDDLITLRVRRPSDMDAVVAASHDAGTRRWLDDDPLDPVTSDADRQTAVDRAEESWRTGQAAPLVIASTVTDEPLGLVNLQFRDDSTATVAYSVFPAHRGRGVAPRAVELIRIWALEDLGVEVLLLEVDAENAASIKVAGKCGFGLIDVRFSVDPDGRERRTNVYRYVAQ